MSYNRNDKNYINVRSLGVIGDGTTDDTESIQRAIDYVSIGGGGLYFPRGEYLTDGYLHVTGNGIKLKGEPGSQITTSDDGDYRKINISGATGFSIQSLNLNGGRLVGTGKVHTGMLNFYNAADFEVKNLKIEKSVGVHMHFRADSHNGLIERVTFEDFHVGVYSDSNDISGVAPNRIKINECQFLNSWGTYPEQSYFGGIKMQNVGFEGPSGEINNNLYVPARSYGHQITNNVFSGCNQMSVELWAYMSDSIVSNNYITDSHFGISIAASSNNIIVDSNNIKACSYIGIEVADSQDVVVSNNSVDGSTGNLYKNHAAVTSAGIVCNGINRYPGNHNVIGNMVRDCEKSISFYNVQNINLVGNTLIQSGQNCGQNISTTNSSQLNISNNLLFNNTGAHYIVFIADSDLGGATGITIANNDFKGKVSQWGLLFYQPVSGKHHDVLIENNRTHGIQYCGYGMLDGFGNIERGLIRNNYGQSGGLGYALSDRQVPAGSDPYQSTDIENGYQFYSKSTLSIPSGGIPSSSGGWVMLSSGNAGGGVKNQRFIVKYDGTGPPYSYDSSQENLEFFVSSSPYGGDAIITAMPTADYYKGVINQIRTFNDGEDVAVWIRLNSGSTGTWNYSMSVYSSDSTRVAIPEVQLNTPEFPSNSYALDLINDNGGYGLFKTSKGYQIGSGGYLVARGSGILSFEEVDSIGIGTTSPSAQLHTTSSVRFANFGAGTATFDADGNVSSSSDERLKDISGYYNNGLSSVTGINPIIYKWNATSNLDTENYYLGFSAQNVKDNIPDAVYSGSNGFYSLSDRAILATLLNTVKELNFRIKELENAL